MPGDEPKEIHTLLSAWGVDHAALSTVVRQALGRSSVDIVDVHGSPIYGGASGLNHGIAGVYRVTGIAHDIEKDVTWSLVFKLIGATDAMRDPAGSLFWGGRDLGLPDRPLARRYRG
jgi:hypothetical protein